MKLALAEYDEPVRRRIASLVSAEAADRIWRHDASFWGGDAERHASVANRLGWLDVAGVMREHVAAINAFAAQVRADGFADAVLLGMGGSSLAPEVLRQSIAAQTSGASQVRLHVLDTTNPATIAAVTKQIDPAKTLFFISSKSGTTLEALSLFAYFHSLVEVAKPGRAGENFVAVTDAGTPLETLAHERAFRHVFTNPGDIGGRYSALSYFGLVPAAVAGVDIAKLLDRGIAAATDARAPDSDALRLGAALGELALAGRDKCTFVVAARIASFGLWVEQLIAESTGKLGKGILPVADEPLGAPSRYGDDRVFVQLRLAGDDNAGNDAAIAALSASGAPVVTIDLADAYDLGREFVRWEFAIAVVGHVLEINPFDEPNVKESKDNTNRVLGEFTASGKLDVPGIDGANEPIALRGDGNGVTSDVAAAIRSVLSALRPHDYLAITAYVQPTEASDAAFREIRAHVRDEYGVATTLGYGPRFLHSTGQLHKGGPATGVFLQVTAGESEDIAIPGKPFTFGQLKRAQGIGDFESIVAHGRPVLRVHIGAHVETGLTMLRNMVGAVSNSRSAGTGEK